MPNQSLISSSVVVTLPYDNLYVNYAPRELSSVNPNYTSPTMAWKADVQSYGCSPYWAGGVWLALTVAEIAFPITVEAGQVP